MMARMVRMWHRLDIVRIPSTKRRESISTRAFSDVQEPAVQARNLRLPQDRPLQRRQAPRKVGDKNAQLCAFHVDVFESSEDVFEYRGVPCEDPPDIPVDRFDDEVTRFGRIVPWLHTWDSAYVSHTDDDGVDDLVKPLGQEHQAVPGEHHALGRLADSLLKFGDTLTEPARVTSGVQVQNCPAKLTSPRFKKNEDVS